MNSKTWKLLISLDVVLLTLLAGFIAFYDLGNGVLTIPDELWEVQAAIEMKQGDKWWLPTYNNKPYAIKPPLKMWLTWPAMEYFAGTNFSFRFIDALLGVLTTLLLYCFALTLFGSRLNGWVTVIAFLGCEILIRYHGIRRANQDSALVFFSTLALFAGWKIAASTVGEQAKRQLSLVNISWALVGGLSVGAAVMTKSAAGIVALIIVAVFCLLNWRLLEILKRGWLLIALVLLFTGLSIGAYFVPICIYQTDVCSLFFATHVYERVFKGYHSVAGPWFYLIRLFPERAAVPPTLLALGALFALYHWLRHRDERYWFILLWAVVPVACFSISVTKLSWYIAPALGGMALLVGALVDATYRAFAPRFSAWWNERERLRLQPATLSAFFLLCWMLLFYNLYETVISVTRELPRLAFDEFVEDVRQWERTAVRKARILSYKGVRISDREEPYYLLIKDRITIVEEPAEIQDAVDKGGVDFVLLHTPELGDLESFIRPSLIAKIAPHRNRFRWLTVLGFGEKPGFRRFTPTKTLLDFGSGDVEVLDGFATPGSFENLSIRWTNGPRASFLAQGNELFRRQGAEVWLNLTPHLEDTNEKMTVDLTINGHAVYRLRPKPFTIDTYRVDVPANVLHPGKNFIELSLSFDSGRPIEEGNKALLLNWISFRLKE